MRKKILAVISFAVIFMLGFFVGYHVKQVADQPADTVETSLSDRFMLDDITQIEVYWLDGSYTIDKKDGIAEIMNLLDSMKLEEIEPNENDGDMVGVYIYTANGECRCVDIWKNDIRFDGHFYVPETDRFEKFVEIFNKQLPKPIAY